MQVSMLLHLQKRRLSPTGRLNLGFITKGKLTVVLITPSSWGSQQCNPYLSKTFWRRAHQDFFWCRCRGERSLLQGESLTLNLFTLLLFLLSYFCLLHFIKNPKKNQFTFYSYYFYC